MKKAVVKLRSLTPYSQGRYHDTEKLSKETHDAYEKRTWRNKAHVDENGIIYIPAMAFANSLKESAKYLSIQIPGKGKSTYTKHFESGVMCVENVDIGIHIDDVKCEAVHVPSDGQRGGTKRVMKYFPKVLEWGGVVEFLILDDIITKDVFIQVLENAGNIIGIGRFRPRNWGYFGRFEIVDIDFK